MNREVAIGIVIALIFILLIIFYLVLFAKYHIHKIKSYNQKLYQKDIDFQKTLTSTVIETQEQVLQNISQDLHDDAGQQLTYINFQLENLKLDSPQWDERLAPLSESLGNLSQSIRNISYSLNNQLLMQQDLLKAIASEMERLKKNKNITIDFSIPSKSESRFSDNEKIIIYRIFQECINNSLKHSKAKKISLTISGQQPFEMIITDEGIGFDTDKKQNRLSIGLCNMAQRAASINCDFKLDSVPGSGTTVILTKKHNTL